jgi:2-polyprenyl-3-methyl-5-hydroxy-6-metoxy-1,4-benzoquinol methylase
MKSAVRPYHSSPEVDAAEQDWWNRHAALIARVWEMNDEVSRAVRGRYLAAARDFFLRGEGSAVTIVELGCGSGWVGQSIAGPKLRIIGTDFSSAQIELARANAARRGVSDFVRYEVASAGSWPSDAARPHGVLIHAFLHHLSGAELDAFFATVRRHIRNGTKIFVYEPAFYASGRTEARPHAATSALLGIANWVIARLSAYYERNRLIDEETRAGFLGLMHAADRQAWYLSPKEVPFDVGELTARLREFASIDRSYWATVQAVGWTFETNLVTDERIRKRVCRFALPLLLLIDRMLANDEAFLRQLLTPPNHAFRVWEAIAR